MSYSELETGQSYLSPGQTQNYILKQLIKYAVIEWRLSSLPIIPVETILDYSSRWLQTYYSMSQIQFRLLQEKYSV